MHRPFFTATREATLLKVRVLLGHSTEKGRRITFSRGGKGEKKEEGGRAQSTEGKSSLDIVLTTLFTLQVGDGPLRDASKGMKNI